MPCTPPSTLPALQADLRARRARRQRGAQRPARTGTPTCRRPDLGRRLLDAGGLPAAPGRLVILLCDGLSAAAVQRHAAAVARPRCPPDGTPGPIVVAAQGRVALGDALGESLGAEAVLVLIGERPGLTSPDSLGAYLTWQPARGRTDAERNCVSNIRPGGLRPAQAADKLLWLIGRMRALRLTGVALKDEQPLPGRDGQDKSISVVST